MLIRPARGRFLSGIDSQVFLPMMTAFCLLESMVHFVIREKYAISFLLNKIIKLCNIQIVLECFMKQDYKLQATNMIPQGIVKTEVNTCTNASV
jgi:hypothetical protein